MTVCIVCVLCMCIGATGWAAAASKKVSVDIPTDPVTLDGQKLDNSFSQHPFISYHNTVYIPLTSNNNKFWGITANSYEDPDEKYIFIGKDYRKTASSLSPSLRKTVNPKRSVAAIPSIYVLLNSIDTAKITPNQKLQYPILKFRNVLYAPLTWDFIVNGLGWKYSLDSKQGLQIDSSDPRRPVLDYSELNTSPGSHFFPATHYVYGEGDIYYVGYPVCTVRNRYNLVVERAGGSEQTISLEDTLSDNLYSLYSTWSPPGSDDNPNLEMKASINGDIFTIFCNEGFDADEESPGVDFLLKVDLNTGKVISKEPLPLVQDKRSMK